MPAIAALTVNDGATTPVAHTYSPVTTNGASAQFADRSAAVPSGQKTISHEIRRPATPTAAQRVLLGFNQPVENLIDGSTVVSRNSSAQVVFNFAPDSTLQERKDLLATVANSLGLAAVKTSVTDIEPFY